ncbi:MAG: 30S ribosomal protein S6 [Clostridia bacterium]|nr:30S ribosomal protein S6 [Clostridia bacterium]
MRKKYETIFILKPDLEEEAIKAEIDKVKGVIENGGGQVTSIDEWGMRKLAYEVKKLKEGYYVFMTFDAAPELPRELERVYKINDNILRHIIVRDEE